MNALRLTKSGKRALFGGVRLGYERFKQLFLLPACYREARAIEDCPKTGVALVRDLLEIFFSYRTLPTYYGKCRLWEIDRRDWKYYYGSNYWYVQQARIRKVVEPTEYRVLFNDKHLCGLVCRALGIRVPRTIGVLDPSGDFRAKLRTWLTASAAGRLIIKPQGGRSGRDIVIAVQDGVEVFIESGAGRTPLSRYELKEKAIVQEVVAQHKDLAAFSPSSVNTLRIATLLTRQGRVLIPRAAFRMGVGPSFVDNWFAGGVAVGVDCETGRLKAVAFDKAGKRYTAHPTSGIVFGGYQIPAWERILATAVRVQNAFPMNRFLGLDIALEEGGEPVLIEINHGPDFVFLEQTGGPLLGTEPVLRAFGEYGLLVNRHQKRLYAGLRDLHPSGSEAGRA